MPNIACDGINPNAMRAPIPADRNARVGGSIIANSGVMIRFSVRKLGAPMKALIGMRLVTT